MRSPFVVLLSCNAAPVIESCIVVSVVIITYGAVWQMICARLLSYFVIQTDGNVHTGLCASQKVASSN